MTRAVFLAQASDLTKTDDHTHEDKTARLLHFFVRNVIIEIL
jgi:hypothetical protein